MNQYDIASVAGDGIGPEVTTEAFKVMRAAAEQFGFGINVTDYPLGTDYYLEHDEIFPDSMFEECTDVSVGAWASCAVSRAPNFSRK